MQFDLPFMATGLQHLKFMDQKIYIKDWLKLKPYKKQTSTDLFYLRICNDVKKAIISHKEFYWLSDYLYKEEIDLLSCFLTSYLEDLISDTGIWNAFISAHQRFYQKQLPFYDLDEYYDGEINQQDISFLIWYFLNTIQDEKFIPPFKDSIINLSGTIMDIFDKYWETAPENTYLKSLYQIDENEDDFYQARKLIEKVIFQTYLFYPDTFIKLHEQESLIIKEHGYHDNILSYLNENRDNNIHSSYTRLLSFRGNEWAAEIIKRNSLPGHELMDLSNKISGYFLYKGQDERNIFIEHIASGKKFDLTKKSFDHSHTLIEQDSILFLGIVRWRKEWWFSGVFFQRPFDAELILSEKNSLSSSRAVHFLDFKEEALQEMIQLQFAAFQEFNNGSQIAFLPSDKIMEFNQNYIEHFNSSLNPPENVVKKARQNLNDGYSDTGMIDYDFTELSETGLVFFNPKSGCEFAFAVNSAFPLPANLYFREEDSKEHVIRLLMDESLSTELAYFCIDNCKNKLTFFKNDEGKFFLNDMDFLLRFWKKSNYHTTPTLTLKR